VPVDTYRFLVGDGEASLALAESIRATLLGTRWEWLVTNQNQVCSKSKSKSKSDSKSKSKSKSDSKSKSKSDSDSDSEFEFESGAESLRVFVHPGALLTDKRHHSKIQRAALAKWAASKCTNGGAMTTEWEHGVG
jgi:hypothetical protein